MITLAKSQTENKMFAGLMVPYDKKAKMDDIKLVSEDAKSSKAK